MADTFSFFAYDALMEAAAVAAVAGTSPVGESTPAVLDGFVLRFSAVSRDCPRLGLPNILPISDATVEAAETCRGVMGVLHTLPAHAREPLLRHMAQRGSYNVVCGALPVRMLTAQSEAAHATVVAALDMNWLAVVKAVPEDFSQVWTELPLPHGTDEAPGKGGSRRWPGYHWCNYITSTRTAPSADTLSALRDALASCVKRKIGCSAGAAAGELVARHEAALAQVVPRAVTTDQDEARTWYLAYGSNMSWEQLCVRIGPPYQRRAARLPHYVLVANKVPADPESTFGYYNVEPLATRQHKAAEGLTKGPDPMPDHVCGAAYEISAAQLALMDGYEWGYTREWLPCEDISDSLGLRETDTGAAFGCGPEALPSSLTVTAAWAYIATETSEKLMPSAEYLSRVLEGQDAIPPAYAEAIRRTPTNALRSPRQEKRIRKEL